MKNKIKKLLITSLSLCVLHGCKSSDSSDSPETTAPNETINTSLSNHVYFIGSSTIENLQPVLLDWYEKYGLETTNLGKGGELIDSMCIRVGALPAHAKFLTVQILKNNKNYFEADWTLDYSLKPFQARINDIKGTLGVDSKGYYFIPNDNFSIETNAYTPIYSNFKFDKNSVIVVNLGKNNLLSESKSYSTPEYVNEKSNQCIEWLNEYVSKRIVIIGHFTSTTPPINLNKNVDQINNELNNNYQSNFFDLKNYLQSKEIWQDTNISPTTLDLQSQTSGALPINLSSDNIHLNQESNKAVSYKLYKFIKNKNWVK